MSRGERIQRLCFADTNSQDGSLFRPIEQHYRKLKDELGLDHFEGRSYRGWNHHAVIAALAFMFLQLERPAADEAVADVSRGAELDPRHYLGALLTRAPGVVETPHVFLEPTTTSNLTKYY